MTPTQLKALAHLPAVLDALEALAVETERLRELMARAGGPARPEYPPPRLELAAKATPPAQHQAPQPIDESPVKRERREWLESMKGNAKRQEKLSKFAHDGAPAEEVVASVRELELSGSDE
jgi:hypothetical protein